ncbi:Diacylglycerol O-acyltransferase 2B [Ceratobasidium theobromae]|uniref:Diacylglycerol O-acyltransferase 2B n=1 Tax=Ceratobasidium theobromae TaxID=1582974 RepID=A0A5N5QHR1_9AGAM|nr:Diacylglycerol O-acyltransferase 2B [Ceratobasidium theobromae]
MQAKIDTRKSPNEAGDTTIEVSQFTATKQNPNWFEDSLKTGAANDTAENHKTRSPSLVDVGTIVVKPLRARFVANKLNKQPDARPGSSNSTTTPENSTALVDKVTDQIRGQSMSLPDDTALSNSDSIHLQTSAHTSHSGSDGDSSDKENSRKRKLSSRSSVATETAARQHLKRPKESDVPEREEDTEEVAQVASTPMSLPKATQVFGFGAFASAKSPFVSTQSTTSTAATPPTDSESRATPDSSAAPQNTEVPESEVPDTTSKVQPPPTPKKPLTGFAAFATSSPFSSAKTVALPSGNMNTASPQRDSLAGPVRRSKSPVGRHQAFGQYSAGVSRFGAGTPRKTQDEPLQQPNEGTHQEVVNSPEFEDILKAKGEEAGSKEATGKLDIHQVQYNTGEEDDLTVFQTRAKLYTQDENFAYKERGTGLLKVNVRRKDGEGARIVMRAEGVLRLLLNMALYPGLICELGPDPKFVKVAEITSSERKLHAIKVGNAKIAQELYDHLSDNTPTT